MERISRAQIQCMRKSQCCRAVVWRISGRRRQCSGCRRSWRIRQKRRGRPRVRSLDRLIHQVLIEHRSLTQLARRYGMTRQALSYRFLKALESFIRRSRAPNVGGSDSFVLLIDGLRFRFKRRPWVLYLMAFKSPQTSIATFIDPVLQEGPECRDAWRKALKTIPAKNREKIRALVCDNFRGGTTIATENRWVLQLCQFHLKAAIYKLLGRRFRLTVTRRPLREEAYALIQCALTTHSDQQLAASVARLSAIAEQRCLPYRFTMIIREFVRRVEDYRAYMEHPSLQLPRTTSSIESKGRMIRDLMGRARSLKTPRAVRLWATAYVRLRPTVTCRPTTLSTN